MSANIDFQPTAPPALAGPSSSTNDSRAGRPKATMILPYDILFSLQGRRVTVMLSVHNEELEGLLRTVDSDRGDLFLEDVVHYEWVPEGGTAADASVALRPSRGGGGRREVRRVPSAMVNSRFVDIVTPTLFDG